MLADEYGLDNLDLTCDWIDTNPDLGTDSVNNGARMQPITDHQSNAVLRWMLVNIFTSGYTRGVDNPGMVTQHLFRKKIIRYFPLSDVFF